MKRVVLDTNVLVSAVIAKGNEYKLLKLAKLNKIKVVISKEIIKEFEEVIKRQKFGFSEEQVEKAVFQIKDISEAIIPLTKLEEVKADPDDNKILECAIMEKQITLLVEIIIC